MDPISFLQGDHCVQTLRTVSFCIGNLSFFALQPHLLYHTSAIVAAAIESASIPWRLKKRAVLMSEVVGAVNWQGNHNIASLGACLPLDALKGKEYTSADQCFPIEAGRFSTIKNFTVDDAKVIF